MTNPFDEADGGFRVLVNQEGQHSLWPAFAAVPDGWSIVFEADQMQACVDYVDRHWTDMRPASLVGAMADRDGNPAHPG